MFRGDFVGSNWNEGEAPAEGEARANELVPWVRVVETKHSFIDFAHFKQFKRKRFHEDCEHLWEQQCLDRKTQRRANARGDVELRVEVGKKLKSTGL